MRKERLSRGTSGAALDILQNIAYIQHIKTKGGQDLSKVCTEADMGDKLALSYTRLTTFSGELLEAASPNAHY